MGRAIIENRNIRKLSRVGRGNTYSLTLPIEMIRKLKWQRTQKIEVELDEKKGRLIIKDWK
jgi:bifunctional DNA-binding transcriptional regulator/antitoxin component of YhaV-PrlF toxin-antitoxin module